MPEEILSVLHRLDTVPLIGRSAEFALPAYLFGHVLVRDTLYAEMPPAERRLFHSQAAHLLSEGSSELIAGGASPAAASSEADQRIGDRAALADVSLLRLRAQSYIGRHPVLALIVLPVVLVPLGWAGVLLSAAAATGLLSSSLRGSVPPPSAS